MPFNIILFTNAKFVFHRNPRNMRQASSIPKEWQFIICCLGFTFHPVALKLLPALPIVTVRSHIPGKLAAEEKTGQSKQISPHVKDNTLLQHHASHAKEQLKTKKC